MLLREFFDNNGKTAVITFGRLNPPTVGHKKLVEKVKSIPGNHYLFLSHTCDVDKNPLDYDTKVKFVESFFDGITVGHKDVRTPIQALEYIQSLGYQNVIFVAGSDRVESFKKVFEAYNGKPDKTGHIPFTFKSISVVSAGERDPDADDVSGMSASKLRESALANDFNTFKKGVPDSNLAKPLFEAVQQSMTPGAVTPDLLKKLEVYLDKMFSSLGMDVEFTRHFLDRANDERNGRPITIQELAKLFRDTYVKWGKKIARLGPDAQAVIKDMSTDINVPFVLNWDNSTKALDLVAKTVMRKKNFATPNQQFQVENIDVKKNKDELIPALEKFFPIAMKVLELEKLPKINLEKYVDPDNQPSFGRFTNDSMTIDVGIKGRHPNDILRTLAHELVHYKQMLDGQLNAQSGDTGSREENDAHARAGIIMRIFNKKYPEYIKSSSINLKEHQGNE
jgi:hypothetical protein